MPSDDRADQMSEKLFSYIHQMIVIELRCPVEFVGERLTFCKIISI